MSLLSHFKEFRNRIFLSLVGILIASIIGWFLFDPVFQLLKEPLEQAAERREQLVAINFTGVASPLDLRIKVSIFIGIIISSPWWVYQLWAFITPGLTGKEKRRTIGFTFAAVPLFLGGAVLAWAVLPYAVRILTDFLPAGTTNLQDAQNYIGFVTKLLLAFGLAFLMPVVVVILNMINTLSAKTLRNGWRWAVLIAFTFAAVMTPTPDALTMILVALPICFLYGIALIICEFHDRKQKRNALQNIEEESTS